MSKLTSQLEAALEEVRQLKNEAKKHTGDVVEAYAFGSVCPRWMPQMRACAYSLNQNCDCRAAVLRRWPEHDSNPEAKDGK